MQESNCDLRAAAGPSLLFNVEDVLEAAGEEVHKNLVRVDRSITKLPSPILPIQRFGNPLWRCPIRNRGAVHGYGYAHAHG